MSQDKSLTIDRVTTTIFRLPMQGMLRWGPHSALAEARHVLVRVMLSDGSTGMAEAPPRPTIYGETVHSICSVIEHELAPRMVEEIELGWHAESGGGMGFRDVGINSVWRRLEEVKNNHAAKAAIDMALHDALAQSHGTTLADWLGVRQEQVEVSYILGMGDRETVLAEADRIFRQGVRVLKVKVGRTWRDDLALIEALQAEFGSACTLYADANECLTAEEAPAKLAELAEMGLHYCEEPLPVEQIRARAAIRKGEYIPLIADDSAFTVRDLARELDFDTFDVLNIKTARTGYTASQQMLALALAANKGVMVGSQASTGLGTARAALFAARPGIKHPSELSFFLKLTEDIVAEPIPIVDGTMRVADALRTRVDPDLLRAATVS